jgi:hypothetical protein
MVKREKERRREKGRARVRESERACQNGSISGQAQYHEYSPAGSSPVPRYIASQYARVPYLHLAPASADDGVSSVASTVTPLHPVGRRGDRKRRAAVGKRPEATPTTRAVIRHRIGTPSVKETTLPVSPRTVDEAGEAT